MDLRLFERGQYEPRPRWNCGGMRSGSTYAPPVGGRRNFGYGMRLMLRTLKPKYTLNYMTIIVGGFMIVTKQIIEGRCANHNCVGKEHIRDGPGRVGISGDRATTPGVCLYYCSHCGLRRSIPVLESADLTKFETHFYFRTSSKFLRLL